MFYHDSLPAYLFSGVFCWQFRLSYPELYASRCSETSDELTGLDMMGTKQPLLKRSLTKLRNFRLWRQHVKHRCQLGRNIEGARLLWWLSYIGAEWRGLVMGFAPPQLTMGPGGVLNW